MFLGAYQKMDQPVGAARLELSLLPREYWTWHNIGDLCEEYWWRSLARPIMIKGEQNARTKISQFWGQIAHIALLSSELWGMEESEDMICRGLTFKDIREGNDQHEHWRKCLQWKKGKPKTKRKNTRINRHQATLFLMKTCHILSKCSLFGNSKQRRMALGPEKATYWTDQEYFSGYHTFPVSQHVSQETLSK